MGNNQYSEQTIPTVTINLRITFKWFYLGHSYIYTRQTKVNQLFPGSQTLLEYIHCIVSYFKN